MPPDRTLTPLYWHCFAGTALLALLCWHRFAGTALLVLLCWHRFAGTALLDHPTGNPLLAPFAHRRPLGDLES